MTKTMLLASAAMIGGFLATHANAQGVPQTVDIAKVDFFMSVLHDRFPPFVGAVINVPVRN